MGIGVWIPFGHFKTTSNKLYIGKLIYDLKNLETFSIIYIKKNIKWYIYGKYDNGYLYEILLTISDFDGTNELETHDIRIFNHKTNNKDIMICDKSKMTSLDKNKWKNCVWDSKINISENKCKILNNGVYIFDLDIVDKEIECTVGYNHMEYPLWIKLDLI